jgi:hypothetical protein
MPRTSSRSRDDRDSDRDDRRGGGEGRGRGGGRDRDDDRGDDGGRGGSRYQYKPRSAEEVGRRAKQSSGKYDKWVDTDAPWFKPHDGENQIRIIGWLNGAHPKYDKLAEDHGTHWGIDVMIHNNVGVDNGSYLCLDKAIGEPCPICDVYKQDDEDALRPSDRVICWLIDRASEKSGPMLWSMPLQVSKDISAASQVRGRGAQDGEALMIDDPDEGYDVFFDKEGAKKKTRYTRVSVEKDSSPLHENQKTQDKWLDYVADNCLPELFKTYEVEYLEKVLSGQSSRKDDADEDDRGSRSRGRDRDDDSRGRGRSRDDGESEERSSRSRGRDREEPEAENDRGSRRGRGRGDAGDEEEFSRPARGRGRTQEEPEDTAEEEPEAEPETPSRRSEGRRGRDAEAAEEGGSRRRGRSEPEKGEKTERYRGKAGEDKDDGDGDVQEAKERLSNVGRRSRR